MEEIVKEKYKVAVIEDDQALSKALKEGLENAGLEVVRAFDGVAGLELVLEEKPDLVLLDILMPKKDGFYTLEELRKNPAWKLIPIIVLSSLGDELEIKRALELGADNYFVKFQHPMKEVIEKAEEYLFGGKSVNPPKIGT